MGRQAAERAISRLGSKKAPSAVMTLVVDNRAAGRLMGALGGPLSGASLQQKRSFLEGKLGQAIGSPLLDVVDDPLIPKAFGSRLYDSEGIAAKRRPVFEKGVLRSYYIDTYYGKKLKLAPTSGGVEQPRLDARDEAAGRDPEGRRRGDPGHRLPRRQLERNDRRLLASACRASASAAASAPSRWAR